jgi:phage recombination protein Bet
VLGYCRAAGLDPMQKPVHIVPMWDSKAKEMRDVIMPGVGLYRTQASRTGQCAGISEPEFGPDVDGVVGGEKIIYPAWCKVTVKRRLPDGTTADFTAVERWLENYAVKGGQEKSTAPNAMWRKRPYGQIAKCAEAQALRKAFPEIASAPTADEMEGKPLDPNTVEAVEIVADPWTDDLRAGALAAASVGMDAYQAWWREQPAEFRTVASKTQTHADMKAKASEAKEPAHVDG